MATLSRSKTNDMYSWWWNSHITPKNSKWLKENLTDMDSKVRTMIRLIEVDEDSFARRAEMYYKRRPELMKLVEEFYRAYRALAERYDHATGVIRHAHQTMAEAFPNQVPFIMSDDHDFDPCTPEMRPIARVSIDPDELKKDDFGLSQTGVHGDFTDDSASLASKKGPKQHNDMFGPGKVRKVLNFHEVGRGGAEQNNDKNQAISESERSGKSETDIQALKEALSKLEAEKQAGLLQYQQTLERLSKLESEFSCAQQDSKGLNERASKAEAEVESLRESLAEVEDERKASLLQYQQCLDRISNLESSISRAHEDAGELHDRASKAENKAEFLREEMSRLKAEKESLLAKYMEALEKIANLENKLLLAEDYSSRTSERADIAEKEVESLKQTVSWLTEEKEALALQYQQCLKKIATLEHEIALVQEEAERLKVEVQEEVAKLKGAEEQCVLLDRSNKSLQSELDTLMHKMGLQNQELSEKQQELGRLWTCIQEERMRFMEAEASFQTLQNLHSKTQEELRSAGLELQKRMQILQDMETNNQKLQDEVKMIKDENKNLNDINLSSAVSIERLQTEMSDLKEGKGKLEELVLRLDQTNALQQKIYCLKEEVSDLNKKHRNIVGQVESVGFEPECFSSSVKGLQDENSNLKESCQKIESEKVVLAEKLELMEKLIEKNTLLENSLSDLGAELEGAREKVKALEESYELLTGEKSAVVAEKVTLISQLDITTENLEKLSERNNFLENSLSDATTELEALRMKCKNLEDSCRLLNGENSVLIAEKQTLASQLESIHKSLEELGRRHAELELRYSSVEEERQIKLRQVEELEVCLDVEKKEHANSVQLSQVRMADLENQISVLQEVGDHMREEFEEELDKAVHAQLEIFILQRSVQDLKEENSSLMGSCEKLLEASKLSEKLISELEHENLEKVDEVRMLSDQVKELRMGMFKLLTALKIDTSPANEDYSSEDRSVLLRILSKLDDMENSLQKAWDENQELVIQKSILVAVIRELKHNMSDLNTIMITLSQGLEIRNQQLVMLQKETQKLLQSNEELMLKVRDGNQKEIALATELFELQGAYRDLHRENCKVIKENGFLMNAVTGLQMEKHDLEEKYSHLYGEALTLDNISLLFKNIVSEKSLEVINLTGNLDELCGANDLLEEKIRIMEEKMEEVLMKNMTLELSLKRSDDELKEARIANDELKAEIENRKNILCLKEMECEDLRESFEKFDAQIHKTHNEHAETLLRLEALHSEVENGKEEVKLWETVASTFFTEVQSASVREALLKDKFSELIKLYENLDDESYLKGVEIRELKEKVGILEGENSEVKSQLAAYISAILCIRESVASLEKHTTYRDSAIIEHLESAQKSTEEIATAQSDELLDLQDLQSRIKSIENAFIEAKKQPEHEHSTVQIESLKPRTLSRRGSTKSSRHSTSREDEECNPGIIERDESLPKDIMLDQISEPSSRRKIRREKDHVDDQLLDLWDPTDRAGKPTLDIVRERKSRRSSSESLVEKELGVDEQERPSERIPSLHHEENKRKTLERLASDIQKLTNLQITVQDLKEKLDLTQTNVRKQKSIEYDNMKDQLEETEKTILKLFDYGGKLMKNVEGSMSSSSFDGLFSMELSDGSGSRKRRVSDQARRISEKIGRLQLEVQKVQFFLMKSNNNRPGKTGGRITEPNTRVVLQDYLYGSTAKRSWRRKKARFCGCIQPPTKSD